jgi:hypothetical protein
VINKPQYRGGQGSNMGCSAIAIILMEFVSDADLFSSQEQG